MRKGIAKKLTMAFTGVMLLGAVAIPAISPQTNVAEARSDYYVGYDDTHGNVYFDTDSIKKWGWSNGIRVSEANIHFADGTTWNYCDAAYTPDTGAYYWSGGAGGWHPATGWRYNFAYYCDQFAYGG